MKKKLFVNRKLILFSLVLFFSFKIFATYPGYPDLNTMPEPSAPSEDLVYADYVPTQYPLRYPECSLFGLQLESTTIEPYVSPIEPSAPPIEDEDENIVDDRQYGSDHLYPQLDEPAPTATSPRVSLGWWSWLINNRLVSWFTGKRQDSQVNQDAKVNLEQRDQVQQAILDVNRHELDEQMAQNLQHEEELRARENLLRKHEEERLSEVEVARILREESNVAVESDRNFVSQEKNREIEAHINDVLLRINTLEDLHLLCEEFAMSYEKIDDLTSILGAGYLEDYDGLSISPEGMICIREFITSHIEELSR